MITNSPETNIEHVKIGILHFLNSVAYEPAIARATVTTIFDALKRSTIDLRNLDDPFPDKGSRIISYNNPCRVTDWSMLKEALTALKRDGAIEEEQRKDEEGQIKGTGRYHLAPTGQDMLWAMEEKHGIEFTEAPQQQEKTRKLVALAEQAILRMVYDSYNRNLPERAESSLPEGFIVQELAEAKSKPRWLGFRAGNGPDMENPFRGSPSIIREALTNLVKDKYIANTLPTSITHTKSYTITDYGLAYVKAQQTSPSGYVREELLKGLSPQGKDKAR